MTKKATTKKVTTKKQASAARKTAPKSGAASAVKPTKKKSVSLGRPLIPVGAPLEVVFETDAEAQAAFQLLEIETVSELVKFTPDELVQHLTRPAKQTVGRIRRALATHNRALSGDEPFVVEFKREQKAQA